MGDYECCSKARVFILLAFLLIIYLIFYIFHDKSYVGLDLTQDQLIMKRRISHGVPGPVGAREPSRLEMSGSKIETCYLHEIEDKGVSALSRGEVTKPQVTGRADSMQVAMRSYVLLAQCFGLLPVCGILSDDPKNLVFTWKAKRVIYCLLLFGLNTAYLVLHISAAISDEGMATSTIGKLLSLSVALLNLWIILAQSRSWPKLMVEWSRIEHQMSRLPRLEGLPRKTSYIVFIYGLACVVVNIGFFSTMVLKLRHCSDDWWVLLQLVVIMRYRDVISIVGYSTLTSVAMVCLLLYQPLVMVYDELTITVLCYCLYLRFKQLREHICDVIEQRCSTVHWAEVRLMYNSLSRLTHTLDNHFSWMTVICFCINVLAICSHIYEFLKGETNVFSCYMLTFAITKTFSAALMASSVHEESKNIMDVLFSIPSSSYNIEVSRLMVQATHEDITITGCHFFSLTRSFILSMAGTIITYVVVLMQMGDVTDLNSSVYNATGQCGHLMNILK